MSTHRSCLVIVVLFVVITLLPHNALAKTSTSTPVTVEETVRAYFQKIPVMIEIARCESKFTQHNADGTVLHGGWGGQMIGVFQFYGTIHRNAALALGFDIDTLKGNLAYAEHLHSVSGTTPWNSSKACWENTTTSVQPPTTSASDLAVLQARVKALTKQLEKLRKLLKEKQKLALR